MSNREGDPESWLKTKLGPMVREELERASKPVPCDHVWMSHHKPGHDLYWVNVCMICHEPDWDFLDSEIRRRIEEQMADLAHATENDTDLFGDHDARHWAERFASKFIVKRRSDIGLATFESPVWTEELMLTWFAGAIESGNMTPRREAGEDEAPGRILPQYRFVLGQEMEEAIGIALGRASVCWESMEHTGVFDSTTASQLTRELMDIAVQFAKEYPVELRASKTGEQVADTVERFIHSDTNIQDKARNIVVGYFNQHAEVTDDFVLTFEDTYVVWFCKTLQNWKALVSTGVPDGMYYEITYDGDKRQAYLDAYKKHENVTVQDEP